MSTEERKKVNLVKLEGINYIVVDNEAFDWNIEPEYVKMVQFQIKNDPEMRDNYIGNIFQHFTKCFSDFMGREVSLQEINEAIQKGYING